MENSLAKRITSVGHKLTLHEDYSGRNMQGQTTSAVSGTQSNYQNALLVLAATGQLSDNEIEEAADFSKDFFGKTNLIWY